MGTIIALLIMMTVAFAAGAIIVFALLVRQRQKSRADRLRISRVAEATQAEKKALNEKAAELSRLSTEVNRCARELASREQAAAAAHVRFDDLQRENVILKRDLVNIDLAVRRRALEVKEQQVRQDALDERAIVLGKQYLKENVKWIGEGLNSRNFTASKQRLLDVIERVRGMGFEVSFQEEETLVSQLKTAYEAAVKEELRKEEQARIRAQIREEQKLQREIERELEKAQREKATISAALEQAIAKGYEAEISLLRTRLADAEARAARAVSQAQLTKAGNVYVISNIGTFGDGVFKVGMTRRLEPLDRVAELGDASVPFPFDVHMMISCEDAPALERALHRHLHKSRMNKVNPRKEFFRTDLETIRTIVEAHHGTVEYVMEPPAEEYRQTLTMSETDASYIDSVYETEAAQLGIPGQDEE
jgi:hypothetical protein